MRQIVNLGKQKLSSSISNEPGSGTVDAQAETGDWETLFGRGNRSIERTPTHSSNPGSPANLLPRKREKIFQINKAGFRIPSEQDVRHSPT